MFWNLQDLEGRTGFIIFATFLDGSKMACTVHRGKSKQQ